MVVPVRASGAVVRALRPLPEFSIPLSHMFGIKQAFFLTFFQTLGSFSNWSGALRTGQIGPFFFPPPFSTHGISLIFPFVLMRRVRIFRGFRSRRLPIPLAF